MSRAPSAKAPPRGAPSLCRAVDRLGPAPDQGYRQRPHVRGSETGRPRGRRARPPPGQSAATRTPGSWEPQLKFPYQPYEVNPTPTLPGGVVYRPEDVPARPRTGRHRFALGPGGYRSRRDPPAAFRGGGQSGWSSTRRGPGRWPELADARLTWCWEKSSSSCWRDRGRTAGPRGLALPPSRRTKEWPSSATAVSTASPATAQSPASRTDAAAPLRAGHLRKRNGSTIKKARTPNEEGSVGLVQVVADGSGLLGRRLGLGRQVGHQFPVVVPGPECAARPRSSVDGRGFLYPFWIAGLAVHAHRLVGVRLGLLATVLWRQLLVLLHDWHTQSEAASSIVGITGGIPAQIAKLLRLL